jgi:predicted RNA-binding Zn-ribbon protein involved in translation (DUF1610 family)
MRYARLYSTLMSQAPSEFFTAGDVLERMRQSVKEDFRWPLAMFEKVLPVRMMEKVQIENVTEGLNELVKAELVEACDEKGLVYELSSAGFMVADGVLHEVSKAAFCITQCRPDGIKGHDAVLLVRSSSYLFLFELAGEVGVLATLNEEGADLFLSKTMEIPDLETVAAAALIPGQEQPIASPPPAEPKRQPVNAVPLPPQPAPQAPPPAGKRPSFCAHCGKTLKPGARFCPGCGQPIHAPGQLNPRAEPTAPPVESVCPQCGNPIGVGAKFCRNCGTTLI